jgi:hypothetical protein
MERTRVSVVGRAGVMSLEPMDIDKAGRGRGEKEDKEEEED